MNFNKKVMYLYIDKNCTICSNFGKKIVKQNQNIKIKDYTVKGKSIIFETDKNIYYEFEAINKALETIGIENKFGNEGIQYTFNNEYPPGATRLTDGSALFVTTQSPFIFYGDVNGDEILNVLDIVVLLSMILGQLEPDFIGDMNQDGIINILDVVILVNNILA